DLVDEDHQRSDEEAADEVGEQGAGRKRARRVGESRAERVAGERAQDAGGGDRDENRADPAPPASPAWPWPERVIGRTRRRPRRPDRRRIVGHRPTSFPTLSMHGTHRFEPTRRPDHTWSRWFPSNVSICQCVVLVQQQIAATGLGHRVGKEKVTATRPAETDERAESTRDDRQQRRSSSAAIPRRRRLRTRIWRERWMYLFILPGFLYFVVFRY